MRADIPAGLSKAHPRAAVCGAGSRRLEAEILSIAQRYERILDRILAEIRASTEAKRVLGKILFWDEQLSSNDTIPCGGCHRTGDGGGDPRVAIRPGPDQITPSVDDILGSPGVVRSDATGLPVDDPVFGFNVRVTSRSANSFIGAAYAPELFGDGRATAVRGAMCGRSSGAPFLFQMPPTCAPRSRRTRAIPTCSNPRSRTARSPPSASPTPWRPTSGRWFRIRPRGTGSSREIRPP